MKNNKGLTIIELIVTVGLISMIMTFLFSILLDLNQEEVASSYKSTDVINKSIITKTIQNDFLNLHLRNIKNCTRPLKTDESGNTYELVCLNFIYDNNITKELSVEKNKISYAKESWTLNTGTYDINFNKSIDEHTDDLFCYNYKNLEGEDKYYFNMVFYVNLRGHAQEDNVLLNIDLFHIDDLKNTEFPKNNTHTLNNSTNICESFWKYEEEQDRKPE